MAYGESGVPHHEIAGLGGAHERAGAGVGGGSDTGCPMPITGSDIRCPGGDPGCLVSNPDPRLWAKEVTDGIGQLGRQAGKRA
jgi:hypothetical protein